MSSGVVIVAPAAVPAAAGALPVLAIAGAAVLAVAVAQVAVTRAAVKAAEYGEQLERAAEAQARGEINERIWLETAAHVGELNARIELLAARVSRTDVSLAVPARLSLAGCNAVQASQWCVHVAEQLKSAQIALCELTGPQQFANAARDLPSGKPSVTRTEISAALTRYQTMMRERYLPIEVMTKVVTRLDADMQAAMRSLDPDAYEDEHARVLATAAQVAKYSAYPTYSAEAHTYLLSLKTTIGEVNTNVARRRLAAKWLHALEDPIVAGSTPPDPYTGTAAKLRSVVSGDGQLSDALYQEASKAVVWADDVARRNYLREVAHACFTELGYEPAEEFDVQNSATLAYRKAGWSAAHSARVWIDEDNVIQGRVLSSSAARGDEVAARDSEHCTAFAEDMRTLSRRIEDAAVRTDAKADVQHKPEATNVGLPATATYRYRTVGD